MSYPLNPPVLDPRMRVSLVTELTNAVQDPVLESLLRGSDASLLRRNVISLF